MRFYIYLDDGVSLFSFEQLKKSLGDFFPASEVLAINAEQLREGSWVEGASLLAIPGGRDIPYDRKLRGKANSFIRRFVEEGGLYLGICAGAYYGAARVIFEKGLALEVDEERELGFFPGAAVGTLYGSGRFDYDSCSGVNAAHLCRGSEKLHVYYNGGCAFDEAELHGVKIEATYEDADGRPAIVLCDVGRGCALLSGVHLEYSAHSLNANEIPQPHIEKLISSEHRREGLFRGLLERELRKDSRKQSNAQRVALS